MHPGLSHKFGAPYIDVLPVGGYTWAYHLMGSPYNPSYVVDYLAPFSHRMSFEQRFANTLATIGDLAVLELTMNGKSK